MDLKAHVSHNVGYESVLTMLNFLPRHDEGVAPDPH